MNLWIVTIGSSDVQLDSKKASQTKGRTEKQHSDKVWSYWYTDELKAEYGDINFEPKRLFHDLEEPYRVPPRALGGVYQASSEQIQQEIWNYLTFPLLDNFVQELENHPAPAAIVVLLTDQSAILQNRKAKSPYWQDTCELKPILQRYFQEKFPGLPCEWMLLDPTTQEQSLENWNAVLELVREKFRNFKVAGETVGIASGETVYVSHQAGTPAISSAVQFVSLATFRDSVQFLVSNENTKRVEPIAQSTYLGAIRSQEAKALLQRHDYSGVRDVLGLTQATPTMPQQKRVKALLDAGEQWNFAEFHKFKNKIIKTGVIEKTNFPWWRLGYESAYLALIRLQQGDTVEALFHSFRAMEGMISQWAERHFRAHILLEGDPGYKKAYGPQIKKSIVSVLQHYFDALSKPNQEKFNLYGTIGLYGDPLYELFRQARPEWKDNPHIEVVWKTAKGERNTLFHSIEGLQPEDVFEAWDISMSDDWDENIEKWEARLRGCLNFIAEKDIPFKFESLEEVSLMAKVHVELEKAIAQL